MHFSPQTLTGERVGEEGVFFRGDGERLVVKNSVLESHLSCQRADTGHPGTRGLWCSESGHWPSFTPPTPLHSPLSTHQHPLLQHPTYKTLLSRPISSVLYCHPDLDELPSYSSSNTSSTSLHLVPSGFLCSVRSLFPGNHASH